MTAEELARFLLEMHCGSRPRVTTTNQVVTVDFRIAFPTWLVGQPREKIIEWLAARPARNER
jgi:hypothetical protein